MKQKILMIDKLNPVCKSILLERGFEVFEYDKSFGDWTSIIDNYDGLIIRTTTKISRSNLENCKRLKVIACAAAGIDNIDLQAAEELGIKVFGAPEAHTIAAAEHTFGLMLMMCRHTAKAISDMKNGKWLRETYLGTEVKGKTIGIIGVGRIGTAMAIRANAFGMKVLGNDIIISDEKAEKYNIEYVDLKTLLSSADIITLHVPLTDLTYNMISSAELNICKDGVMILNVARGKVINENDLLKYLNSGKVSFAALDVFSQEPVNFPSELINHPNVIATPHIGAMTREAKEKVAIQVAEQISDFFTNK